MRKLTTAGAVMDVMSMSVDVKQRIAVGEPARQEGACLGRSELGRSETGKSEAAISDSITTTR
jgi:hypothetical protein